MELFSIRIQRTFQLVSTDIDSDDLGGFDETDARFLEEMIKML